MHVALITSRFTPEASSAAKRATDLAGTLRSAGHRVTVLTQVPNYPDPAAFDHDVPPGSRVQIEEDGEGSATWRFVPRLAAKEDLLGRFLAEARFAMRVSRRGTRLTDLSGVFASTPFVFNLAAARTYRLPLWLDVRDLTWEYARDLFPNSRLKRLGAALLRSVAVSSLRVARRVSTTTESQRQYLIEHGVPARRVEVVPNGIPVGLAEKLGRLGAAGSAATGEPVRVVYSGLLGFPQGLEFAVESIEEMSRDGVELHLFGEGVDRPQLEHYCRSRGLPHVHIHGHVPHDRYLEVIAAADVLFASLRPEVRSAMPSKIWEYMATGKPILFAGSGEAASAIETAGAGVSIPYGDRRQFRERLLELARDPELRRQLGTAGRDWVLRNRIREEINRAWVERMESAFESTPASTLRATAASGATGAGGIAAPVGGRVKRALARTATLAASGAERAGVLRLLEMTAGARGNRLAVLTYHRVADDDERPRPSPGLLSASPAAFHRQMAFLAARCHVVSMDQVLAAYRGSGTMPARAVLVTFDDAYSDFAENAWPVMRRLGLPVTLFVPTAFPDRPGRSFWWDRLFQSIDASRRESCATRLGEVALGTPSRRLRSYRRLRDGIKSLPHGEAMETVDEICAELGDRQPAPGVLGWDALRGLSREGVTLGAHTRTHPLLDRISREEVRAEVAGSLEDLEREIGEVLPVFAYPGGHTSDEAARVLAEEGIELAFAGRGGINDTRRRDKTLRLRRVHVGPRVTRPILRAQILGLRPPAWLR